VVICDREPFKGGAFGDIFRASHEGQLVALKRLRVFAGDEDPDKFTPVSTPLLLVYLESYTI
jgi:hypothetical protein